MRNKRNLWITTVVVILLAALVSGFVLMRPSAKDILVQTLETVKTITDGHAVVAIEADTIEQDASGTFEVWAVRGEETDDGYSMGGFRIEVLEASEAKAQGAVIVSDGQTLWAYSPSENKVFVGTPEEAQAMMAENEALAGQVGQFLDGHETQTPDDRTYDHPETAEEAVAKLFEYFNVSISGSGSFAGETASQLKLEPIAEQMPAEYLAIGGYLNLWIGQDSSLPLSAAYTGGSVGEFSVTVLELEVNAGVDQSLFTFEIPEGAEVVTFADLEPQALTLDEAQAADFEFLIPAAMPPGATLVDILEIRGAIVQRYTLPEGGSFTVAQGASGENSDEAAAPSAEIQTVELRGTTGNIVVSKDGTQVILTWVEGGLFYSVAGDLTSEQAISLAESLQ